MKLNHPAGSPEPNDPSQWNSRDIDKWFEKGEWLEGWKVKPDASVNRKAFAVSYHKDINKWRKAFTFLREINYDEIEFRRYEIDNEKVYAIASNYLTKNENECNYEAHRKYIDIQYVFKGSELIGLAGIKQKTNTLVSYDAAKDIEFMTVSEGINLKASPNTFFIFFPEDAHRPGLKDGESPTVGKVVVKLVVG